MFDHFGPLQSDKLNFVEITSEKSYKNEF
jgi:hypothetical protein